MELRDRLERACLYLIADVAALQRVLADALRGGVDVVQLRDKDRPTSELRAAAVAIAERCHAADALFILNDEVELAAAVGADGVHIGQDDMRPAAARAILGDRRLVGLSTHSAAQIEAAKNVDYIGVGPIFATPTKPGRSPVGLELVRHAAANARVPFFAIGGINAANVAAVRAAGAQRVAVVRAIADAANPTAAARDLLAP